MAPAGSAQIEDRRQAPRFSVEGQVKLRVESSPLLAVEGWAVDQSSTGFRIRHDCRLLRPGQRVYFEAPFGNGFAIVVWSRILPESVETGLRLEERDGESVA